MLEKYDGKQNCLKCNKLSSANALGICIDCQYQPCKVCGKTYKLNIRGHSFKCTKCSKKKLE